MTIFLPLLICVLGLLVYALAANPKVQELGRLSFFAGLLVFLLQIGEHIVSVFGK